MITYAFLFVSVIQEFPSESLLQTLRATVYKVKEDAWQGAISISSLMKANGKRIAIFIDIPQSRETINS